MIFRNEDVKEVIMETPDGHKHVRTTVRLQSGEELVFQEATIANICRAYLSLKTHPATRSIHLVGKRLSGHERKEGFADWQLIE